jgi:hypothetical protein
MLGGAMSHYRPPGSQSCLSGGLAVSDRASDGGFGYFPS